MRALVWLLALRLLPTCLAVTVASQPSVWQQCAASCNSFSPSTATSARSSKLSITLCQVWENQDSVIDPAVELGLQTLRRDFGDRVDFAWIKAVLPGGCTDETLLQASPAAVDLQMVKSVNGVVSYLVPVRFL